jgi:hypothetical protein
MSSAVSKALLLNITAQLKNPTVREIIHLTDIIYSINNRKEPHSYLNLTYTQLQGNKIVKKEDMADYISILQFLRNSI